jgi:hypothetical protein
MSVGPILATGTVALAHRIILITAGTIAVILGVAIMFMPHAMHESNGVELGNNASLLSEIRSPGGALFLVGAILVAGAFVTRLTFAATLTGAMVYLGYGLGRVVSIVLDGVPSSTLVVAMIVEFVGAAALAWLLWRSRKATVRGA